MPHNPEYETAVPCTLHKMLKAGKYCSRELCLVLEIILLVYYPILYELDVQGHLEFFTLLSTFQGRLAPEQKQKAFK